MCPGWDDLCRIFLHSLQCFSCDKAASLLPLLTLDKRYQAHICDSP